MERKTQHQVHQYINLCSEEDGCLRVKRLKGSEDMILKKNFLAAGLTSLDGKIQTEVRLKDTPDFFSKIFYSALVFFKRPDFVGSICDPKIELPQTLIPVLTSSVLMKIMCYKQKDKVDIGGKQAYEIL